MNLRADLTVPKAGAYVIGVQRIPGDWLACTVPNLQRFAQAHPGWGYYVTGGMQSSWLAGATIIREAELTLWP